MKSLARVHTDGEYCFIISLLTHQGYDKTMALSKLALTYTELCVLCHGSRLIQWLTLRAFHKVELTV